MNKLLKDKGFYVLVFITIFILSNLLFGYRSNQTKDNYFERVERNYRTCLKRAEEDSVDKRWCHEIESASVNNFYSTDNHFEISLLMNLFLPVLFGLIITTNILRKQVQELKEKIDA